MVFLQLLKSELQDAKSLSADVTRSVAVAVLSQKNERSILAVLEKFGKDLRKDDKRIASRFSRGDEGLWESARKGARSTPDSQFLSEIKSIPANDDLHQAS